MWIEYLKHKCRNGETHYYPQRAVYVKGKRVRQYVGKQGYGALKFQLQLRNLERRLFKIRRVDSSVGRPPSFHPLLKETLEHAGYSVDGFVIKRHRINYLDPEHVAYRFSLMDPEQRAVVGNSERLLAVELLARKLLKSSNRRGIYTTFSECFRKSLELMKDSAGDSNGII